MMFDPRPVTVVILTFNGLKYTRRCLETLQANTTHPDYHVIVVDNGSTDGTPRVPPDPAIDPLDQECG